jgi:branched-chain amino acid transport system permease protein
MSSVILLYLTTIIFYFFSYGILSMGLNIQYGLAGIVDFALIVFFAVGAYFAGVFAMGPANPATGVTYILGATLPWPLPLIGGAVAAGVVAALVGVIALRRLRSDYLGIATFSLGFIAYDVIGNASQIFGGFSGLSGVPEPLSGAFGWNVNQFTYYFTAIAGVIFVGCFLAVRLIDISALGRVFRAVRDNLVQAESLGINGFRYRMIAMIIGGVLAGISGALTIEFIGSFNTSGWSTFETFIIFAAVIVGGSGNKFGVIAGALVFPTLIVEGSRFLPTGGVSPALIEALRNILIGVVLLIALWFRPQGVVPEKARTFASLTRRLKLEKPLADRTQPSPIDGGVA